MQRNLGGFLTEIYALAHLFCFSTYTPRRFTSIKTPLRAGNVLIIGFLDKKGDIQEEVDVAFLISKLAQGGDPISILNIEKLLRLHNS